MGASGPGASQHLPRRARGPRRGRIAAGAPARLLRGADHGSRGLRRELRFGSPDGAAPPGAAARRGIHPAARHDGAGGAAAARERRGASARLRLPAHQRRLRALSAAGGARAQDGAQGGDAFAGPARSRSLGAGAADLARARAPTDMPGRLALLAPLLLALACEEKPPGRKLASGMARVLTAGAGAGPVQIAPAASAFAWSPVEPALAFAAPGRLGLRRGRESLSVPIEGLQAIGWSPDGKRVAARASAAAGGKLWLIDAASGAKREVAPGTSDFAFAPDGALAALGPPAPKGGDRPLLLEGKDVARATAFAFSPDGRDLALLSTARQPGEATGELLFLARYDLRARAGVLTVAPPEGAAREIASKVQGFMAQGPRVLYLVQAPQKGDFKIELWAAELESATPPRKIDEGVYGWQVSRDGATLYYKARCAGGPRSCSLLRQPLLEAGPPTFLAAYLAGFNLSADGSRILVQQPHRGSTRAVDLAVIPATGVPPERLKVLVEEADPGSRFADAQGKCLLFATLAAGKAGVYVVEVR